MTLHLLLAFWGVSLLFILSPGMDWAYIIAAGTQRRRVIPAVTGLVIGHFIIILLVAMGLASLLKAIPLGLPLLTIAGAIYLFYIGICQLRTPITHLSEMDTTANSSARWMYKGVTISLFNPKVMMIIIAILPQFIHDNSSWGIYPQIMILGTIHCLTCYGVYLIIGYSARALLAARPQAAKWVSHASACAMTAIALTLLGNMATKWL